MKVTHINTFVITAALTFGLAQTAAAHGETVHLFLKDGKPSVGLKDGFGVVTEQRAFKGNLVWNQAQNGYSTSSPGWSWSEEWMPEDKLGFAVVTAVEVWDGFKFVADSSRFRISQGSQTVVTQGSYTKGFEMVIGGDDHKHLRYTLLDVANGDPNVGVYRLNFAAYRDEHHDHTIHYPAFGLVLNRGESAAVHNAAYEWALANPVPEPASMLALGAGLAALVGRRRRR